MMTHDEMAEFAAERMRKKGYLMTWANMRSTSCNEQPDVMALKSLFDCVIIEVKTSRGDFFADRKKPWRNGEVNGMGTERIYFTPPNLLKPEEIPYGWQLWELHEGKTNRIQVIKGMKRAKVPSWDGTTMVSGWVYPHCEDGEVYHFRDSHNVEAVNRWLLAIMRRISQSGVDVGLFGNADHLNDLGIFDKG